MILPEIVSQGYVSLDLETTGLPWQWCQILEVGAVWDDWKSPLDRLPRFHCYVVNDRIVGEPFALAMNVEILKRIANREKPENKDFQFLSPGCVMGKLKQFIDAHCTHPKVIMAGKNYASFDDRFLGQLPGGEGLNRFHRCVDPGMRYWNPRTDVTPPGTEECLRRAGILTDVKHDAINDALDVIRLIRTSYNVGV